MEPSRNANTGRIYTRADLTSHANIVLEDFDAWEKKHAGAPDNADSDLARRLARALRLLLAPASETREERNVYRLTAADVDAHAGREVTDGELRRIVKTLEFSELGEVVTAVLDSCMDGLTDDEDPMKRPCEECRADAGQPCEPYCTAAPEADDEPEAVFDGTCAHCQRTIRTDTRQDETGSTRCDDTDPDHEHHLPAAEWEEHPCEDGDCEQETHLFPPDGITVAVLRAEEAREVGEDRMFNVPEGAEGIVLGSLHECFDVHVQLEYEDDGEHVVRHAWISPDNLRTVDAVVRDTESSASRQHYIDTGKYLPA